MLLMVEKGIRVGICHAILQYIDMQKRCSHKNLKTSVRSWISFLKSAQSN